MERLTILLSICSFLSISAHILICLQLHGNHQPGRSSVRPLNEAKERADWGDRSLRFSRISILRSFCVALHGAQLLQSRTHGKNCWHYEKFGRLRWWRGEPLQRKVLLQCKSSCWWAEKPLGKSRDCKCRIKRLLDVCQKKVAGVSRQTSYVLYNMTYSHDTSAWHICMTHSHSRRTVWLSLNTHESLSPTKSLGHLTSGMHTPLPFSLESLPCHHWRIIATGG